ncbi:MAG: tetratricopeptide repeat protein, partial [Pirellulales bacterium]
LLADGGISRKLQLAIRLNREGNRVEIIPETEWLAGLGLVERHSEVRRLYTSSMLARVLHVSVETVHSWIRRGLLRPVRRVFRLAYFDFQEAAGAKRLAELIAGGVSPRTIERALASLKGWLPNVERPLTQLALLADAGRLLVRRGDALVEPSGQRRLPFADVRSEERESAKLPESAAHPSTAQTVADWYARGEQFEEEGELEAAADAYRNALMLGGPDAEAAFALGHTLYRMGRPEAARERFAQAVECDPDYVEAWNNLGSVLAELGRLEAAADAFRCALAVYPDYADAHYHLADTLEEMGEPAEAAEHWRAYLCHDSRSSWAEQARQRLALMGCNEAE